MRLEDFRAIRIANHTGSIPNEWTIGTSIGTTTKAISIKSIKKPNINIRAIERRIKTIYLQYHLQKTPLLICPPNSLIPKRKQ